MIFLYPWQNFMDFILNGTLSVYNHNYYVYCIIVCCQTLKWTAQPSNINKTTMEIIHDMCSVTYLCSAHTRQISHMLLYPSLIWLLVPG